MCFHFLSDPGNPRPTKLNFLLEVGIENLVNIILAIQQVLTLYIYIMTNNNAHQLPALIKVSSFMQPQRFSLQSARARSLGSAACLVLSGKVRDPRFLRRCRQKVSESITSSACRAQRQRGLRPSALTEVLRSPRLVEQSRAHLGFGDSRLRKPSPWRTDTLYATVKTTRTQIFRSQQLKTTASTRKHQTTRSTHT